MIATFKYRSFVREKASALYIYPGARNNTNEENCMKD
jgi:hypothetical protein